MEINLKEGYNEVRVGDEIFFSLKLQESVGLQPEILQYDEDIFEFVEKKIERARQDMSIPGSDDGECTFILKAIKEGICHLKFQQVYRGEVEEEYDFEVEVIG